MLDRRRSETARPHEPWTLSGPLVVRIALRVTCLFILLHDSSQRIVQQQQQICGSAGALHEGCGRATYPDTWPWLGAGGTTRTTHERYEGGGPARGRHGPADVAVELPLGSSCSFHSLQRHTSERQLVRKRSCHRWSRLRTRRLPVFLVGIFGSGACAWDPGPRSQPAHNVLCWSSIGWGGVVIAVR